MDHVQTVSWIRTLCIVCLASFGFILNNVYCNQIIKSRSISHHPALMHRLMHLPKYTQNHNYNDCVYDGNPVMDIVLNRMRVHLPDEKINVQSGVFNIQKAHITRFKELARISHSCMDKLDNIGILVHIPFEAEIRSAQVHANIFYSVYITDITGEYKANFSHIRMNGTLEVNLFEEKTSVADFNITSSEVTEDSIVLGYVPTWVLDWVRNYFDNDNTVMYEQLARKMLQREVDQFRSYDLIRMLLRHPLEASAREEDQVPFDQDIEFE